MIVNKSQKIEYSEEQRKNIAKFFNVGTEFAPKEFRGNFLNTTLKIYYEDKVYWTSHFSIFRNFS